MTVSGKVKEHIVGHHDKYIKGNGDRAKSTEKGRLFTKTETAMLATFALANGMDKEHIFIMLVTSTTVISMKGHIKTM